MTYYSLKSDAYDMVTYIPYTHTDTLTQAHTHTYIHSLCSLTHTHSHTHTHTHTHTHIHSLVMFTHKQLHLSDNRLSGGLEALTMCTSLKKIELAGNRIANLKDLKPLVSW